MEWVGGADGDHWRKPLGGQAGAKEREEQGRFVVLSPGDQALGLGRDGWGWVGSAVPQGSSHWTLSVPFIC